MWYCELFACRHFRGCVCQYVCVWCKSAFVCIVRLSGASVVQPTCQAEGLESELCAIEDDEAVVVIQSGRVLHIALKVARLQPWPDLFDLPDINCKEKRKNVHQLGNTCTGLGGHGVGRETDGECERKTV